MCFYFEGIFFLQRSAVYSDNVFQYLPTEKVIRRKVNVVYLNLPHLSITFRILRMRKVMF